MDERDLTYIPSNEGWLYLAVVMDRYSRRIIGWSLESHMRADLVIAALDQALQSRSPNSQTVFHSDRGSQYSSIALRERLNQKGIWGDRLSRKRL